MSDYLIIDAVDGEEHDRYEDDLRGAIADAMVRAMGVPRSPDARNEIVDQMAERGIRRLMVLTGPCGQWIVKRVRS